MKNKIKISYFGKIQHNAYESDRFGNNGRASNLFEFSNSGDGILDLYTEDAAALLLPSDKWSYKPKSNNIRALWITEVRPLREAMYEMIERDINKYMSERRLNYIFSMDLEFCKKDPRFIHLQGNGSLIKKPSIYKKSKLCSMVTSNKLILPMHKERIEYANKFKETVDIFGIGINEIKEKEEGLASYMFSVAIENCRRELTFTEKLLDCFLTGTIPIYYGATNIESIFDKRGIIFLSKKFNPTKLSHELYKSMLPYAVKNFIIANSLLVPIEDALLKIIKKPSYHKEAARIKPLIDNLFS